MELLADQWYPLLESRELRGRPIALERLGERFVFWRIRDGSAHASKDRCPHLGASLACGQLRGDHLICPFHGFEFDRSGGCSHIPANGRGGRIPPGLSLAMYPVREMHGLIWLWWGVPRSDYPDIPFFPELTDGWQYGTVRAEWPVHYSRAIENQLDVAHLPFVHRTTIGAGGRTFVDGPYVQADESGIRVWVTHGHDEGRTSRSQQQLAEAATGREPGLHFLFPGVWLLNISPRLKNLVLFVPIHERATLYYIRVYHRISNPLLAKPFEWLMGLSNRYILRQDRRVVVTQTPLNSADAHTDHLIGADRAIIQFRRWHARLLAKKDSTFCPRVNGKQGFAVC